MKYAGTAARADDGSEMLVVNTFTKLIFDHESEFSPVELEIIQALRLVDENVVLDSHRDMGAYLQALGVAEMVKLVDRVCARLLRDGGLAAAPKGRPARPVERRLH